MKGGEFFFTWVLGKRKILYYKSKTTQRTVLVMLLVRDILGRYDHESGGRRIRYQWTITEEIFVWVGFFCFLILIFFFFWMIYYKNNIFWDIWTDIILHELSIRKVILSYIVYHNLSVILFIISRYLKGIIILEILRPI